MSHVFLDSKLLSNIWGQEENGTTEDEMAGWHSLLDGHEFEKTPRAGDGQRGLACCDSRGRKESDTTERLSWTELKHMIWKYLLSIYKLPFDFVDVPFFEVWCGVTCLFLQLLPCCLGFWCETQKRIAEAEGKNIAWMFSSGGLITSSHVQLFNACLVDFCVW